MAISGGLRRQQAANSHAAGHEEFEEMLLVSLASPEFAAEVFSIPAVADAVTEIARTAPRPSGQRRAGPAVTSAGAAQQLKASRLAARGRSRRG